MTFYATYASPLGQLHLISDGTNLTGLRIASDTGRMALREDLPVFLLAKQWLDDYFAGSPRHADFPLSPAGTPFQRRVWQLLCRVSFGKTTTYGALARQFSDTMSAQAVGQAVGKNPILLIIPCHRCLGTGERLTGFSAGLDNKKWLLRHEGSSFLE